MAAAGGHVKTDVTEQVKTCIKSFVGISLRQKFDDERLPLLHQSLLDLFAYPRYVFPFFPRKVKFFQLGIHLPKTAAYPMVECFDFVCHPGLLKTSRIRFASVCLLCCLDLTR